MPDRIGLIDVDGHNFPNLALMKISAYHKAKGDEVEWWWTDLIHYDIVYMSKDMQSHWLMAKRYSTRQSTRPFRKRLSACFRTTAYILSMITLSA